MLRLQILFSSLVVLCGLANTGSSQETALESRPANVYPDQILGNPDYPAIAFGGFRQNSREQVPSIEELKEDLRILSAIGIRVLRTYNTQEFPHAARLLEAIKQMRDEDSDFEMYVMLGAWINCKNAWTASPDHEGEDEAANAAEIEAAILLSNKYPDTVKVIAVGNEAMVHWAAGYFVRPGVILKWVSHLQDKKQSGDLPTNIWITSSDNFASWGGGDAVYHTDDLRKLIRAVDYVSVHTYPFHDSHYNSIYWRVPESELNLSTRERAEAAMKRAAAYAQKQYIDTREFVHSVDPEKPVHIGETGWATSDNKLYGDRASGAADEFKQKLYYDAMRLWTDREKISCFFFEAFDEPWKDGSNPGGSENHFGLFTVDGQAKFAIWDQVDSAKLSRFKRGNVWVGKTHGGDESRIMGGILVIPDK